MRSSRRAWPIAVGVASIMMGSTAYAFHPSNAGTWRCFVSLGVINGALALAAIVRLRRVAPERLRPRQGDVALGALIAVLSYALVFAGRQLLLPDGSPQEGWLMRVYALVDPRVGAILPIGVGLIAAAEELVWRGLVWSALEPHLSPTKTLVATALLFGVAHLPTVFLLSAPFAGPNPLLVGAGVALSVLWGLAFSRFGRLLPVIIAHALFSWAVLEFPLWSPF